MGLFKRFAPGENKEAPKQEKEAEDLAAEIMKETEGSRAEIGRERIDKIMGGAKELWLKMTGKLSSLAGGAKERLLSLLAPAVGAVEKDIKDTGKDFKAAYKYVAETGSESMNIERMVVERTKEFTQAAIKKTKDAAVTLGYTGAALTLMGTEAGYRMAVDLKNKGIELGTDAAKKAIDAAVSLRDMGVDATETIKRFGADKLEKANNAAKRLKESGTNLAVDGIVFALESIVKAEEMGIDTRKWLEGKGREYLNRGVEIYGRVEKGTKELYKKGVEAKNQFFVRAQTAKTNFVNWINKTSILMASHAELRGEVSELKDQLARVTALLEARTQLDSVEPEINLADILSAEAAQEALA